MTSAEVSSHDEGEVGWNYILRHAANKEMWVLAAVAQRAKLSIHEVSRRSGLTTKNLKGHFLSRKPQAKTFTKIRRALNLADDYGHRYSAESAMLSIVDFRDSKVSPVGATSLSAIDTMSRSLTAIVNSKKKKVIEGILAALKTRCVEDFDLAQNAVAEFQDVLDAQAALNKRLETLVLDVGELVLLASRIGDTSTSNFSCGLHNNASPKR